MAVWNAAMANCPFTSRLNDSPVKAENVVMPPRKPVTSSRRHASDGARANATSEKPISRPPIMLTASVPAAMGQGIVFSQTPARQRARQPAVPPAATRPAWPHVVSEVTMAGVGTRGVTLMEWLAWNSSGRNGSRAFPILSQALPNPRTRRGESARDRPEHRRGGR